MRYFVSAGEPSGDLHGANLIRKLRECDPNADIVGFGGPKMQTTGARLLYPLADDPVMGLIAALRGLPKFARLLNQAESLFRQDPPDALVMIDYPGFHWHLAKRAKKLGVPVFFYVPPQIWGWGTWRVAKMRRYVDHVLCSLPFEEAWYHARGVKDARYVGHPFFDDLADRKVDEAFIARQRAQDDRRIVALLPGSRTLEIKNNFAGIVHSATIVSERIPNARFLIAGFKEAHRPLLEKELAGKGLPADLHIGKTPEIIRLAEAAISVSGSVSLELLYHGVPTAIVYRVNPFIDYVLQPLLLKTPYITLVNLMAGRLLFPEFYGCRDRSKEVAATMIGWLESDLARLQLVKKIEKLKSLYGVPGANALAAWQITETIGLRQPLRQAG